MHPTDFDTAVENRRYGAAGSGSSDRPPGGNTPAPLEGGTITPGGTGSKGAAFSGGVMLGAGSVPGTEIVGGAVTGVDHGNAWLAGTAAPCCEATRNCSPRLMSCSFGTITCGCKLNVTVR